MLESAVPITELALRIGKHAFLSTLYVHRINAFYHVFRLYAIRSYVLHGTRSHFTRNQAQFLQSAIPHIRQLGNHIVQSQTILRLHCLIVQELGTRHAGMEDHTIEILGKQQIRTLPYMQNPFTFMFLQHLPQLVQRVVLDEQLSLGVDAEGIIRQQRYIRYNSHRLAFSNRPVGTVKH